MKTVLITGIGKGIGKALKERFLSEGYFVVGTFNSEKPEDEKNFVSYNLDLSKKESITSCAKGISKLGLPAQAGKKIDILINNAGVMLDDGIEILIPDKLRQTLEVNLIGTADFTEKNLANLSKEAHIVFVSSEAGSVTLTEEGISHEPGYYPAYKISKAALNMYMATLADRTMKEGLTVSAVHPGWVRTSLGGDEAPILPEEAANDIFKLAISKPQTGGFWFKGKREPW